jgi:hypothetical protein
MRRLRYSRYVVAQAHSLNSNPTAINPPISSNCEAHAPRPVAGGSAYPHGSVPQDQNPAASTVARLPIITPTAAIAAVITRRLIGRCSRQVLYGNHRTICVQNSAAGLDSFPGTECDATPGALRSRRPLSVPGFVQKETAVCCHPRLDCGIRGRSSTTRGARMNTDE